MAAKIMPSQKYLCECLTYDPITGHLQWRNRPREHFRTWRAWVRWEAQQAGHTAGFFVPPDMHYALRLDGDKWYAARVIWKMMTGNEPIGEIDHKNRNPSDNSWKNLREAIKVQQAQNRKRRADNETGYKGVKYYPQCQLPFGVRIQIKGHRYFLGCFATAEEAHEAYCKAAKEHFGEFWCAGE